MPAEWERGTLLRCLVIASGAAGFAVHQAVGADADVEHCLAKAAILLALAVGFRLLTLRTTVLRGTGSGTHEANLARSAETRNVTEVTELGASKSVADWQLHPKYYWPLTFAGAPL